jgi:crotonobetainyl-CoA:carnitine CoA-transferase CaiB-like acyl-CoA transferase
MSDLPLHAIRILDLSRLLPGPYATLILAELGAEVLKIEEPPQGDPLRYRPIAGPSTHHTLFDLLNRGKKSITLNLKTEEGRAILLALTQRADVLLEGYRPGVMQRLGLAYATLTEVNPGLIYASLSGYGQTGPYRTRAGHDLNYIALGGLLGITGAPDDGPAIPGVPVADLTAALWAALGIMAALCERQRTGHGQYLDISMLDSVTSLLAVPLAAWLGTGRAPQRGQLPLSGQWACYNVYRTADNGYMTLAALEPHFWRAFCLAVGREDWLPRQNDADQAGLSAEIAALFRTQPRAYWEKLFAAHDCACEPVLALDEVFAHPQAQARGLLADGALPLPIGRRALHAHAPALGQHTAEILAELGYSAQDTQRLKEQGVV